MSRRPVALALFGLGLVLLGSFVLGAHDSGVVGVLGLVLLVIGSFGLMIGSRP